MTTITPVSTVAAGISVSAGLALTDALVATLPEGGDITGDFSGIFAALLCAAPDEDMLPEFTGDQLTELLTDRLPDETVLIGDTVLTGEAADNTDAAARLLLTEFAQSKAAQDTVVQDKKTQQDDSDDETGDSLVVLGALSVPVEASEAKLLEDMALPSGGQKEVIAAFMPVSEEKPEVEENPLPARQDGGAEKTALPLAANLAVREGNAANGNPVAANADENKDENKKEFAHFLNGAMSAPQAKPAANGMQRATASLSAQVGTTSWNERLGEQIVWMTRTGQQQIDLRLNPAHLGPLSISLNMDGEKATVNFTAATPEVRAAIEEAMPRLREMLSSAGLSLGQANVDEQTREQARQSAEGYDAQRQREAEEQNLAEDNGKFAKNSGENPAAPDYHERNGESASILTDSADMSELFLTHNGRRIRGIDLFA